MRLSPIVPLLSALSYASVSPALARSVPFPKTVALETRQSGTHTTHGTVDTCLYANSTSLDALHLRGVPDDTSARLDLDTCLCLTELPLLLRTDPRVVFLADALGRDKAESTLEVFVSSSSTQSLV